MSEVAGIRREARALVRTLGDRPGGVVARALALHRGGKRFLAYELCRARPRAVAGASRAEVRRLGRGLEGWADVDCYCSFVSGVAWREGVLSDADIRRLARSPDRWERRAALVSTVPLNCRARGAAAARGDARRTLAVCRMLLADRDDMVVKAMSWALRELARRDPGAVRAFLKRHDGALAARARREVMNKLTTGLKNPRGRARAGARA